MIPKFVCIEGCHDCCGRVPFTAEERTKVEETRPDITWRPMGEKFMPDDGLQFTRCAFLGEAGCTIYKDRPMVCRLFGSAKGRECPHEKRPKRMLTKEQAAELLKGGA